MTKFELPEKPKKTNTSEDFNNLRKAVDELDKFDYAWKTHANKADRRINAANKYIEELERENQRLIAENVAVKTLVDNAKPQQALPVVPEDVAKWIEHSKGMGYGLIAALTFKLSSIMHEELSAKILKWLDNEGNDETFALAFITGKYEVEKPQLFYLKHIDMSKRNSINDLYLKKYIHADLTENGEHRLSHTMSAKGMYPPKDCCAFTQQEIDSMETGSYELVPVEDGE